LQKLRVLALSISEETMNDASFVRFDTILERDGQTDGQTDRHRDGRTSLLLQYQHMHDLLCYRAGKISCLSLSFLRSPPDSLLGLCFSIPLGDFRPRDSFASHHPTLNMNTPLNLVPRFPLPHFSPLSSGAAFSSPAFSTPATWCRVFHSRVFHPCNFDGAKFSTPAFSVNPTYFVKVAGNSIKICNPA